MSEATEVRQVDGINLLNSGDSEGALHCFMGAFYTAEEENDQAAAAIALRDAAGAHLRLGERTQAIRAATGSLAIINEFSASIDDRERWATEARIMHMLTHVSVQDAIGRRQQDKGDPVDRHTLTREEGQMIRSVPDASRASMSGSYKGEYSASKHGEYIRRSLAKIHADEQAAAAAAVATEERIAD